jgi:hypothetical protein
MDKKGAAPTLAVFIIFTMICAAAALATFQAGHQRQVSTIQRLMAVDVVRATSSTIEMELNQTLQSAITAAMYEAGIGSGSKEDVKDLVIRYLNERIVLGWSYSNENISVPLCDENSLGLEWLPDGSVKAIAYLAAEVRHISGVVANGISLRVNVTPRFERLKTVAEVISHSPAYELAHTSDDFEMLQNELNENYACEGLSITVNSENIVVYDNFAGKVVVT